MSLAYPTLDAAIAQAEGYNTPGTIPNLANNPGDIVAGSFATAHGATGSITAANGQQIAVFPNADQGLAATDALVANNYNGGDINALSTGWLAGSSTATQQQWASNVSSALGVPSSTTVASLAGGGSPSAAGVAAPSTGIIQSTLNAITGAASMASGAGLFGLSISRAAAFILGLIVLAGAIYLFKPALVTNVVKSGAKAAGAGAAAAAV